MRGQRCAFLPGSDAAAMVAGEKEAIVRLGEFLIRTVVIAVALAVEFVSLPGELSVSWSLPAGRASGTSADPRAEIVRDLRPVHVDGFVELLAVARVQFFDGSAGGRDLGVHAWKLSELRSAFGGVAGNQDARFAEDLPARIPNQSHRSAHHPRDSAVDVEVGFPE